MEQGAKRLREKSSDGWPKRPLARSIPLSHALKPYISYNKISNTMFQSEGAYKQYQVQLSKAREHAIFKGTYKEYQVRLSKAKECHMH